MNEQADTAADNEATVSTEVPVDPRLAPRHPALHAENRQRVFAAMEDGEALLVFASPEHIRNADTEYRYRQHSDVLWLTGWRDPDCAVLLRKGAEKPFVMFVQNRNPAREVWTGRRPGPVGAVKLFGADDAFEWDELDEVLPGLIQGFRTLHYRFAENPQHDKTLQTAIAKARRAARLSGLNVPTVFIDTEVLLHDLRMHKTEAELAILRRAAHITGEAHVAAMAATAPGVYEYELEGLIDGHFRRRGGNGPGYTTIVGSGDNATILHYISNDQPMQAGTLVCVDAGCEVDGYTADVTRTWPVDGVFSEDHRALYEAVLRVQVAAIAHCTVGRTHQEIHRFTTRGLVIEMCKLGLLEGDPSDEEAIDRLIESKAHERYFMHGTGHWLGLDVHDVGAYAGGGTSRVLAPGMVLTIEPGIYVAPDDNLAPAAFRGVGIRIEDDILITAEGPVNLTAHIPKSVEAVEAVCRGQA